MSSPPIRTLTGTLGIEMGDVAVGSDHYHALFGLAVVLLIIALIVNLSAVAILSYLRDGRNAGMPHVSPFQIAVLLIDSKTSSASGSGSLSLPCSCCYSLLPHLWWAALAVVLAAAAWHYGRNRLSQKYIQTIAFVRDYGSGIDRSCDPRDHPRGYHHQWIPCTLLGFPYPEPQRPWQGRRNFPAIVGTLYLVTGAILIALPLGVGAAVYLVEYTREGRITN